MHLGRPEAEVGEDLFDDRRLVSGERFAEVCRSEQPRRARRCAALQPVRRRGSNSAIAPACWLRIACHRNSSNSISPGWVGGRCVGSRRETISRAGRVPFRRPPVPVRDLDIVGIAIPPAKADTVTKQAPCPPTGAATADTGGPCAWAGQRRRWVRIFSTTASWSMKVDVAATKDGSAKPG